MIFLQNENENFENLKIEESSSCKNIFIKLKEIVSNSARCFLLKPNRQFY